MKIVYNNRKQLSPEVEKKYQAEYVELDKLLKISDVISIHVPLTEETYHLMNSERLNLMKMNAILVNTARGPILDEYVLIDALKNNKICSAALDVYEFEPNVSKELLGLDNVILSPHNGTATIEARNEMSRFASQNIIRFFNGNKNITRVN